MLLASKDFDGVVVAAHGLVGQDTLDNTDHITEAVRQATPPCGVESPLRQ